MWGKCANGTEAVGCGRPETFRNCADIAITSNTGGVPPLFAGKKNPYLLYYKDLRAPEESNVFPLVVRYVQIYWQITKRNQIKQFYIHFIAIKCAFPRKHIRLYLAFVNGAKTTACVILQIVLNLFALARNFNHSLLFIFFFFFVCV